MHRHSVKYEMHEEWRAFSDGFFEKLHKFHLFHYCDGSSMKFSYTFGTVKGTLTKKSLVNRNQHPSPAKNS